ncbi:hypothetical protein [Amycolatopsis sp. lyj-112]|uniref:hypothetical protein n=1 Tax=Amycolatopsis sp. lyj-112 TaxID=2789288 RepID=UPI00397E8E07
MSSDPPGDAGPSWLASTIKALLEEKYAPGRVPGVRKISADIGAANGGEAISHGHVGNILNGTAGNLTDRTRTLLATFFGKNPGHFLRSTSLQPTGAKQPDPQHVQALAARLATFDAAQLAAIQQAIEIVSSRTEPGPDPA